MIDLEYAERILEKVEKMLDAVGQEGYVGPRIVEYWGVPGIGKSYLLQKTQEYIYQRNLYSYPLITFPALQDSQEFQSAKSQLERIATEIVERKTNQFISERKSIILIDNAPNEWQEDHFKWFIEIITPLVIDQGNGGALIFLTSASRAISTQNQTLLRRVKNLPVLKNLSRDHLIAPLDRKRTEHQLRSLGGDQYLRLISHIQSISYGLPLSNALVVPKLRDLNILYSRDFRRNEPELVKHLQEHIINSKIVNLSENVYEQIRTMSVCRYFDSHIFSTIYEEDSDWDKLLQTTGRMGIMRLEPDLNIYEVDAVLRKMIVQHWSLTEREDFYESCERVLKAYDVLLTREEKRRTKAGPLAALIRTELTLLSRVYRGHESTDEGIQAILCDRLEEHLEHISTDADAYDKLRQLFDLLEGDQDLFCYWPALNATIQPYLHIHTKARLEIWFEPATDINYRWQVESDELLIKKLDQDPTRDITRLQHHLEVPQPDPHYIGNVIREQLTPNKVVDALEDKRHSLLLSVARSRSVPSDEPLIPYELMSLKDHSFLCLTRPVGRTLLEADKIGARVGNERRKDPPEFTRALLIVVGERNSGYNQVLHEELDQIDRLLFRCHIETERLEIKNRDDFDEKRLKRKEAQLIHVAGRIYHSSSEQNQLKEHGLLFPGHDAIKLRDIEWFISNQFPLVFLNISRLPPGVEWSAFNTPADQNDDLRRRMDESLHLEDVKNLCHDLGIDFHNLDGESKSSKIRELIGYCQRRGKIDDLHAALERLNIEKLKHLRDDMKPLSDERALLDLAENTVRAGARNCIANFWSISDDHARLFAEHFYTYLMTGQMVGEAVRRARLEVRAKHPVTPDWASYVLYGDPMHNLRPRRPLD